MKETSLTAGIPVPIVQLYGVAFKVWNHITLCLALIHPLYQDKTFQKEFQENRGDDDVEIQDWAVSSNEDFQESRVINHCTVIPLCLLMKGEADVCNLFSHSK